MNGIDSAAQFERRLGLHFDFHARPYEGMPPIGETLKEEDIREICRLLRPDFIQIDCKGHPGWTSYPTKLGNAMPLFRFDTLKLWRRVTKEEGVKLFMHYSGVIDENFCRKHPELAIMHPDGKRDTMTTRTFAYRYADRLLIPQLKELAGEYGVDGVWIDGECWGTNLDYDPETVEAFGQETGIRLSSDLPPDRDSADYKAFKGYCRELFRKYVRHYTEELHKAYPSFMITSNWMFSDYMPEPVSADLDYLSGDFNPWNSVNSARMAGRALARQGKPWDLMSWNFRVDRDGYAKGRYVKHPVQIMQEAASVTSLGGGFQNYITQYKDGSPRMEQIRQMKPVFDMVRVRAPWCYGGSIVRQAAVFLSGADSFLASEKLFARNGNESASGLLSLLCDMGQAVSVASEYDYNAGYSLIAVPEINFELGDAADALLNYAREGGSLLIAGVRSIRAFIEAGLPASVEDCPEQDRSYSLDDVSFTSVSAPGILRAEGMETVACSFTDPRGGAEPYACILKYGKGKIALIASDLGRESAAARQAGHRQLMQALLNRLYDPMVRLDDAEGTVEITPLSKDGHLLIQLVNMNGPHSDTRKPSFDRIEPCRNVRLSIKLAIRSERLLLQPEGKELSFTWDGERATLTVEEVKIHEIVDVAVEGGDIRG